MFFIICISILSIYIYNFHILTFKYFVISGVWVCVSSLTWMDWFNIWLQTKRSESCGSIECLLLLQVNFICFINITSQVSTVNVPTQGFCALVKLFWQAGCCVPAHCVGEESMSRCSTFQVFPLTHHKGLSRPTYCRSD